MAGESIYVPILLGLQLDCLSMNPQSVPRVKNLISRSRMKDCRRFVKRVLRSSTAKEIGDLLQEMMLKNFQRNIACSIPEPSRREFCPEGAAANLFPRVFPKITGRRMFFQNRGGAAPMGKTQMGSGGVVRGFRGPSKGFRSLKGFSSVVDLLLPGQRVG